MKNHLAALVVALVALAATACGAPADTDEGAPTGSDESELLTLPPSECTSKTGCGATGPVQVGYQDKCLGAVGSNCNGAFVELDDVFTEVGCDALGNCWINAGSWLHDQCCVRNRDGFMCGGPETVAGTACKSQMQMAVHRVTHNLGWQRKVSMTRVDTDGIVDFAEYCAPGGTIVASTDAIRCCSGQARGFNPLLDRPGNVIMDGTFTPVVCLAGTISSTTPTSTSTGSVPPAPTTSPCSTQADCDAGEACVSTSSGKVCVAM